MKYIPGNIFKNILISSLIDIPLSMLGGYLYHKIGVKTTLIGAFIMAMTGSTLLLFIGNDNPDYIPYMLSLARCGMKVTFDICYLANSLLFPAIFAGTAYGFCNIGAKVATILSPMVAEVDAPVPMISFTSVALVAAVLSNFIIKDEKEGRKKL